MTALGSLTAPEDLNVGNAVLPPGLIIAFTAATAPSDGWLPCDGRAVYFQNAPDGKNYLALYNAIGHAFNGGSAPASDRFRLPGLTPSTDTINGVVANGVSRTPVGPTAGDTRGASGGLHSHSHGLGSLAMPAHTHTKGSLYIGGHGHGNSKSAPNHTHSVYWQSAQIYQTGDGADLAVGRPGFISNGTGYVSYAQPGLGGGVNDQSTFSPGGDITGGGGTSAGGSLPSVAAVPFLGVAWMIKT